jgi:integrase
MGSSMSRRSRAVQVSWHKASGQFIKYIGRAYGKDGQLKPKVHYLGSDENTAIAKAVAVQNEWRALLATGAVAWSERPTALAVVMSPRPVEHNSTAALPSQNLTVLEAATEHLEEIRLRRDAKQVTHHYYEGQRQRVMRGIAYLGHDKPLAAIGESQLTAMVLKIAQRPMVKRPTSPLHPMSIVYCRKVVGGMKSFLVWCYETERWNNRPRRFDKLFRFKPVLTEPEREAMLNGLCAEPPHFTIEELTKLYAVISDRQRLWFLLCLNCGFCTAELDSLRRYEVRGLATDAAYIERFRQKSSVYGKWMLWPETANLLVRFMAPSNPEELAILTERGRRLKEVRHVGHKDAFWQAWRQMAMRSGIKRGSPKLLRKTGAWMTKQIGGLEISEMYLAHQEPGMNKAYAGRRWDKMHAALSEMRLQLQPMFDAAIYTGDGRYSEANSRKRGRDRKPRRRRTRAEMAAFRQQQMEVTQSSVSVPV